MRAPGIRTYLFVLFSVLTAIPVLWLGNSFAARTAERDRDHHDQSLAALARTVSRELETMLDTRVRDLEVLAGSIELTRELGGAQARALLLNHWQRSRYYTGTYIGDADGNSLLRAPELGADGRASPAGNYRDRDYYQALVGTRNTAISKVQKGRFLASTNIQIAAPIFDREKALIGYAEGSVALDAFAHLVNRYAAEIPGSRVVVLDATQGVVADSNKGSEPGAREPSRAPLFSDRPDNLRTAADERGEPSRAALQSGGAKIPGWRVVAALPQRMIDDNAQSARNRAWAMAVATWLAALVLAAIIAAGFGRRFSELAETVSAIGGGRFERRLRPPHRWEPRELGVLVTQVGSMAESLARHTRDLEGLVANRTTELAEVNERLSTLVNALERADDGIEITDPEARFIYVNPAFEKITGYSPAELIGKTPKILRSGRHDAALYEDIWARINRGQVYSGEFVARRKDGSFFDQELTVWPIQDEAGKITHFVGLRRDVTEKRRTERTLRVSERMASIGTLAAGVAHEINNPLTYVLLNLRFIADALHREPRAGTALERMRVAVERAVEGAERMSAIVKGLRTLSRPDDHSVHAFDPAGVLESALRMVANDIRHRARLVRDFGPVPNVRGNQAQLGQVFLNLLVNAVQALDSCPPDRAEITVRIRTDEQGFAVVEFADTGAGIPPEHLNRIFDPFFTTKPVGLGTGIGLSVCHTTVKAMNGEILVESTVGAGSRFTVRLPGVAEPVSSPRPSPPESMRVAVSVGRWRVLVLDDDQAVGEALKNALEDHDVTLADGAEAGLEAAKRAPFDAILCDVMMPGVTGIDFFQRLSALRSGLEHRVIFITGGALTEAARRFMEQCGAPCLEKPISVEQLQTALSILVCRVGRLAPDGQAEPAA